MKNLSNVTLADAVLIVSAGYPTFFVGPQVYHLEDQSEALDEPAKRLHSRTKIYQFYFFDDCIDIDYTFCAKSRENFYFVETICIIVL